MKKSLLWYAPDHLTPEQAASIPLAYSMAYYTLLVQGQMHRGQNILICTGDSSVGFAAIALAIGHGCKVFTTVQTESDKTVINGKVSRLAKIAIFLSNNRHIEDAILQETNNQGVDIILSTSPDGHFSVGLDVLAPCGKFLHTGNVSFLPDKTQGIQYYALYITYIYRSSITSRTHLIIKMALIIVDCFCTTFVSVKRRKPFFLSEYVFQE